MCHCHLVKWIAHEVSSDCVMKGAPFSLTDLLSLTGFTVITKPDKHSTRSQFNTFVLEDMLRLGLWRIHRGIKVVLWEMWEIKTWTLAHLKLLFCPCDLSPVKFCQGLCPCDRTDQEQKLSGPSLTARASSDFMSHPCFNVCHDSSIVTNCHLKLYYLQNMYFLIWESISDYYKIKIYSLNFLAFQYRSLCYVR